VAQNESNIQQDSETDMHKDVTYRKKHGTTVRINKLYTATLNLNSVNQLIFVMVKCGVLFEVRTGFLNNI
jgi:hypothetical protein